MGPKNASHRSRVARQAWRFWVYVAEGLDGPPGRPRQRSSRRRKKLWHTQLRRADRLAVAAPEE